MGRWGSKASRTVSGTSSGSQPDAHRVIISTGHALPLGLAPPSPALTASSQHSSLLPASSSSHALYHVCHSLMPQVRDGHLVHTVEGAMGSKEDVVLPGRAQHTAGTTGASINPQVVSSLADRPLPSTRSDEGREYPPHLERLHKAGWGGIQEAKASEIRVLEARRAWGSQHCAQAASSYLLEGKGKRQGGKRTKSLWNIHGAETPNLPVHPTPWLPPATTS